MKAMQLIALAAIVCSTLIGQARAGEYETCDVYCGLRSDVTSKKKQKHVRHTARHQVKEPRLDRATRSLIATINAKLARWVHPTGKCGAASEQLATFYWQGKRTANGERFNPHGLTAASRSLPFGTRLTITNPHNGRMVSVRINDRGPYTNAKLDLSWGAAKVLGMKQSSYVCVM